MRGYTGGGLAIAPAMANKQLPGVLIPLPETRLMVSELFTAALLDYEK